MDVKKILRPFRALQSNISASSFQIMTSTDQQNVVSSTIQSFVWNISDKLMNLSHPQHGLRLETSTSEPTSGSIWDDLKSNGTGFSVDHTDISIATVTEVYSNDPSVMMFIYNIVHPLVILIGLITNVFTFMVMIRSATRKQRMAVFLIPLTVFDAIKLSTEFFLLQSIIPSRLYSITYTELNCQIAMVTTVASGLVSSWILVAMTLERVMAVTDPLRFKRFWTKKVSIVIVLTTILVLPLLSVGYIWIIELQVDPISGFTVCGVKGDSALLPILAALDALVYSIIPSITLFVLNILIIKGLSAPINHSPTESDANLARQIQNRVLTITVLSISICFCISVLPYGLYVFYYMATPDADGGLELWAAVALLFSLNHSLNFFFYIICGKRFRTEFVNLMCGICCVIKNCRSSK